MNVTNNEIITRCISCREYHHNNCNNCDDLVATAEKFRYIYIYIYSLV